MNAASRWRRDLAGRIAASYADNPKVAAVVVGGSVARGYADRFSDLEMYIFWDAPATEEDRAAAIARAGGEILKLYPYEGEPQEWSDEYHVAGVKVDGSSFLREVMDRMLTDVLDRLDTSWGKQVLISTLQYGLPLFGAPHVDRWRSRLVPYPDGLARAMVERHIEFSPRWTGLMLLERNDFLALYRGICDEAIKMVRVLLGLNRIYDPGIKWLDHLIATFTVAPRDLARRLRGIFVEPAHMAVPVLHGLVDDTLALVETHMPDVDTKQARWWFNRGRAPVEAS